MNKERKTPWTGIAVGLVAALVAPLLALAHHDSGEQSGDDPIQLVASGSGGTSAMASFRVQVDRDVTSYRIEVAETGPGAGAGQHINEEGTVLPAGCCRPEERFTVERCSPWTGCNSESWPISSYTDMHFPVAPATARSISASVRPPDGGRCLVDVSFDDFGTPRITSSSDHFGTAHGGRAEGRVRIGRSAVAVMTMECADTVEPDLTLTSFDAAVYVDVNGYARAVADAENPPQP